MKIYILRHEERTIDASFFGPLTKNGILNSINLIQIKYIVLLLLEHYKLFYRIQKKKI